MAFTSSPSKLTVAISQSHTQLTLSSTLSLLRTHTLTASHSGASIILFPEAFLGGYPRSCSFGAAVGSRTNEGREQFLQYFKSSVDLGDTPHGEGERWIERKLEVNKSTGTRGDGTREVLEGIAAETGVFIVTGCVERAGGSLYCTALFVDPKDGVVAKRRKVQPTGSERLVWSQGQPSSLKVVSTTIKGVKVVMGCAICWENYMPLLRYSLYAQGVNLWLAPTADPRPTWESLMRTIGFEGRCWVLSANQCIKRKNLPGWITGKKDQTGGEATSEKTQVNGTTAVSPASSLPQLRKSSTQGSGTGRRLSMTTRTDENHEIAWRPKDGEESSAAIPEQPVEDVDDGEEFASRGGSLIVSPMGMTAVDPVWDKDEALIYHEVDFEDCARGKLDFDATGHYARLDAFHLTVDGLDLNPPP